MVSATFTSEDFSNHSQHALCAETFAETFTDRYKAIAFFKQPNNFIDPHGDVFAITKQYYDTPMEFKRYFLNEYLLPKTIKWRQSEHMRDMGGLIKQFIEKTPDIFDSLSDAEKSASKQNSLKILLNNDGQLHAGESWQIAADLLASSVFLKGMPGHDRVNNLKSVIEKGINTPSTTEKAFDFGAQMINSQAFTSEFSGEDVEDVLEYLKIWPNQHEAKKAKFGFLKTNFILSKLFMHQEPKTTEQIGQFFETYGKPHYRR